MKKFLLMSMTAAALAVPAFASDSSDLQALKAQIEAQQKQIDALNAKLGGEQYITRDEASRLIANEINASVDTKVEQGLAQMKDSSPILSLGKGIDNLTITGDIRTRWEATRYRFGGAVADSTLNRNRFRTQLRLGGIWKAEGWEVGVGIVGGASADARSNNRDISSVAAAGGNSTFSKSAVWIDYAYAKHTWGDLSLTVGQQKNPYVSTWILFDGDVRPVGATLQYDKEGFFVTTGVYDMQEPGAINSRSGYMGAAQLGYKYTQDALETMIALAWYNSNEHANSGLSGITDPNYNFNIGDLYGHVKYNFDPVTATLYGEAARNFANNNVKGKGQLGATLPTANPKDQSLAWILGAKAQYQDWTFNYGYARIEADAVNGAINDSDWATAGGHAVGTNIKGHKLELTYNVTKNLALSGKAWFVKEVIPSTSGLQSGRLYMVDATWSF